MKLIKQSGGDILDTTAEIVNPYQRCTAGLEQVDTYTLPICRTNIRTLVLAYSYHITEADAGLVQVDVLFNSTGRSCF